MAIRLEKGLTVHGYRIEGWIGAGGEGSTYLASKASIGKVVLKQLNFSASDPERKHDVERVHRTKRLVGRRCPQVVEILDIFRHEDLYYVVMEFVEGESLEDLLKRHGSLTPAEFRSAGEEILQGLGWLHAEGMVHRDVKPANIIVQCDRGGRLHATLIDLDIALHRADDRLTRPGLGIGTFAYMPVEGFKGRDADIDGRMDLYAFGVVLFEILTGRLPFAAAGIDGLLKAVVSSDRPSLRDHDAALTETLDAYVQQLMALQPRDRFESAEAALAAFRRVMPEAEPVGDAAGIPTVRTPKRPPTKRPKARKRSTPRSPSPPLGPGLLILSGDRAGERIPISAKGVTLGRGLVNPSDKQISRVHARVTWRDGVMRVTSLGSANGLVRDGRRWRRLRIRYREVVCLGSTPLEFVV